MTTFFLAEIIDNINVNKISNWEFSVYWRLLPCVEALLNEWNQNGSYEVHEKKEAIIGWVIRIYIYMYIYIGSKRTVLPSAMTEQ